MTTSTPLFDLAIQKAAPIVPAAPLTISALTQQIQSLIETRFESCWIVGQISNLTYHRSNHIYLTLKDDGAQLPGVVWKTSVSKIKFQLKEGMEIVCRGRLTVFPPHGKYQIVITELHPKGIGALELAFQQLRAALTAEGLFLAERKKPLPKELRRIAVLTSPTGAAVKDFIQILTRRTKLIDVLVVPVKVQGEGAAEDIAQAIRRVNQWKGIDCIILTRGGGSIEDLWAFNEEVLVRAVAASTIPVVSAVGHEIDVTLCDFAADVRAATPSEAAERITREDSDRNKELVQINRLLNDHINRKIRFSYEQLKSIKQRSVFRQPEQLFEKRSFQLGMFEERLDRWIGYRLQTLTERMSKISASLESLSPLSILSRGYTLTGTAEGRLLQSVNEVKSGDVLHTRFADGVVESRCIKQLESK